MPSRIQPARDIKDGHLFVTPVNEGNTIAIRLKDHCADWHKAGTGAKYEYRSCGPYHMSVDHESWSYGYDNEEWVSGFASSMADAKTKCMESVLLSVLGCLEFVD
jgi:hypothetical protein